MGEAGLEQNLVSRFTQHWPEVMRFNWLINKARWGGLGLLLLLAACGGAEVPTPTPALALPTEPAGLEIAATEPSLPDPTAVPTSAATQIPTTAPTDVPTATAVPPTNTPMANNANQPTSFAVVFVEPNDVLNVRSGPGVDFSIVGELPPDANDVQITGSGQLVAGSTWVPIQRNGLAGWVNGRFLTEVVSSEAFCGDTAVLLLLDELETAVATQDDAVIAQLIHPERGLRVRLLWHEAETRLDNQGLFSDSTSYNWGAAAGSGQAILGTPAQVLLPRLQTDFLDAPGMACNEILHGGSAGFIILPDVYLPVNFYSFYRPGTDEYAGLNWGTWVVGLEKWQGQYYVSTLVQFQWEP
ncbi:MAG: SH3 domain-containing protein [Anaerolineales bacterium]|nr:SH3 domain-containing protein [Anaerolineales bacterium]